MFRSIVGSFRKLAGIVGFSVALIPFILSVAFCVMKANMVCKNFLTNKDSFFYSNFGDISWLFNLLGDERSSDKKILLIAIFIVLQAMMVMSYCVSYDFEKFREARKSFFDKMSALTKSQ